MLAITIDGQVFDAPEDGAPPSSTACAKRMDARKQRKGATKAPAECAQSSSMVNAPSHVSVQALVEDERPVDMFSYARRIVGWRVSRTAHAGFVLDALEQAVHQRRPVRGAGIEPSVGSVGDSYDNALAEKVNGLFKAEVVHRRSPWRSFEATESATLEWVDWFNNRRLLQPIGSIPTAEAEAHQHATPEPTPMAPSLRPIALRCSRRISQRPSR